MIQPHNGYGTSMYADDEVLSEDFDIYDGGLACECETCLAQLRESIARIARGEVIVVEIDFDDEETP